MKCDVIVLYSDGTWECVEDVLYFLQRGDEVWLHKDHGALHKCGKFAMITIKPK